VRLQGESVGTFEIAGFGGCFRLLHISSYVARHSLLIGSQPAAFNLLQVGICRRKKLRRVVALALLLVLAHCRRNLRSALLRAAIAHNHFAGLFGRGGMGCFLLLRRLWLWRAWFLRSRTLRLRRLSFGRRVGRFSLARWRLLLAGRGFPLLRSRRLLRLILRRTESRFRKSEDESRKCDQKFHGWRPRYALRPPPKFATSPQLKAGAGEKLCPFRRQIRNPPSRSAIA
jgi:hypothetical protein